MHNIKLQCDSRIFSDIGKPNIRCCAEDYSCPLEKKYINPNCIPVSVPKNDPFFAKLGVRCLNYVRMAASLDNDCSISYKQVIIKFLTEFHFLDLVKVVHR